MKNNFKRAIGIYRLDETHVECRVTSLKRRRVQWNVKKCIILKEDVPNLLLLLQLYFSILALDSTYLHSRLEIAARYQYQMPLATFLPRVPFEYFAVGSKLFRPT